MTRVVSPDQDGAGPLTASATSYAYNRLNEISSITDALSGVTGSTYDLARNLLTLDDPVGNTTSWAYDGLVRPDHGDQRAGPRPLLSARRGGKLTRYTDRSGRVIQYVRHDLGRVTGEKWLEIPMPAPSVSIAASTQGGSLNEVQRVSVDNASVSGPS